jgi:hypothetical protein
MDSWFKTYPHRPSQCGYCGKWFPTWSERLDHIGEHYRFGEFDRSMWKLSDDDKDGGSEDIFQPGSELNDDRRTTETSVLVPMKRADDLKIDYLFDIFGHRPVLDAYGQLGVRQSTLILGSHFSFDSWSQERMLRGLVTGHAVTLTDDGIHDAELRPGTAQMSGHAPDCGARRGTPCKFDLLG